MSFLRQLRQATDDSDSFLCVGLDPDPNRLPESLRRLPVAEGVFRFCRTIVDATATVAAAYKPNLAFFEALGPEGWRVLHRVVGAIPQGRIVIADAKRGDIGSSASMYARALFEELGCHACTVSPYMGRDSVEPFLSYPDRATFVLARTSNRGAEDFQELFVEGDPLYLHVCRAAKRWSDEKQGTLGFVVGATDEAGLRRIRREAPQAPFLVPGVGAQGGDLQMVVRASRAGGAPLLVNSSRQILYASSGPDFAEAAAAQALSLRDRLNDVDRETAQKSS